jgi:hypothetical protein
LQTREQCSLLLARIRDHGRHFCGDARKTLAAKIAYLVHQFALHVQRFHVIAAADGFAVDEDVGNGPSAGKGLKGRLKFWSSRMFVDLDDVRRWNDRVEVLKNVLYVEKE